MILIVFFIFIQTLSAQFPINLAVDEISDPLIYQVESDNEFESSTGYSCTPNLYRKDGFKFIETLS